MKVTVLGAGAWGTALALAAHRAGNAVTVWSLFEDEINAINTDHENTHRLPGIPLDSAIQATTDLYGCLDADVIILSPPAQKMNELTGRLKGRVEESTPLVITSKGIEIGSGHLMTEVVRSHLPKHPLAVLSGPSFATDVAKKLPTAVTLACDDTQLGRVLCETLGSTHFRPYYSPDTIGAQIGGSCKNIIAIACGIVEGLGLGDNARAALVTRGLYEISLLGMAMGAQRETFMGLSGMGDITLTSLSAQSRNMRFGLSLGQGGSLSTLMDPSSPLTEGVHTVEAAVMLAKRHSVLMPITEAMNHLLHNGGKLNEIIEALMMRPFKAEMAL